MGGIHKIDKSRLRHSLKKLRQIKTWQLIIIFLLLAFIEATLLRFHHLHMTDLKAAVSAADEAGDEAAIADSLAALKDYAATHTIVNVVEKNGESQITFGTGPVYLEKQYQRQASAAIAAAEANASTDENPNGNVFAKAMSVCKPLAIQYGWAWNDQQYLDCMTGEIAKYPTSERIEDTRIAALPSTGLFRYDFASPVWTFSPTGLLAVVIVILAAIIIFRILLWFILHLALIFVKN